MKTLKNCILIISCTLSLLGLSVHSDNNYQNSSMEDNKMNKDYSKELKTLLKNKAKNFTNPYSFFIQKKQNHYFITVESQGNKHTTNIHEEYVDKLFKSDDKNIEKLITDEVFVPGKK